ncbi:hypothetical protein FMUND_7366 [Fusarium mundagurra]|uniref:Uncharacterized protein n=1 Tax=Fusarium mundagurra TaxID=1567541 RepID=A0A8H5YNE5_9HYPO|nr:hypothetical protein FMUND_7366 [Fusarium mundagurra]
MVERKFQIIDKYDFNRTYHGIAISEQWQAWETAHFFRVRSIIENPTVGARLISYGCNNGDASSLNCTTTCPNATLMYNSPENLWNCMTLATLGMLVGPGNDTIDRKSEKKMDEQFHFGTVEKFNTLNTLRMATELLTVIMIFIGLREMVELLDMHSGDGGLSTWGFGQLVAVAIWFPVMIKFICLSIFGPGRGKAEGQYGEATGLGDD